VSSLAYSSLPLRESGLKCSCDILLDAVIVTCCAKVEVTGYYIGTANDEVEFRVRRRMLCMD
jgi:hypothetical protein